MPAAGPEEMATKKRKKVTEVLTAQLRLSTDANFAQRLADAIEHIMYEGRTTNSYDQKYRSLTSNLKTNESLRNALISGELTPKLLVQMRPHDLATDDLKQLRAVLITTNDFVQRNHDLEVYRKNVLLPLGVRLTGDDVKCSEEQSTFFDTLLDTQIMGQSQQVFLPSHASAALLCDDAVCDGDGDSQLDHYNDGQSSYVIQSGSYVDLPLGSVEDSVSLSSAGNVDSARSFHEIQSGHYLPPHGDAKGDVSTHGRHTSHMSSSTDLVHGSRVFSSADQSFLDEEKIVAMPVMESLRDHTRSVSSICEIIDLTGTDIDTDIIVERTCNRKSRISVIDLTGDTEDETRALIMVARRVRARVEATPCHHSPTRYA